MRWHPLGRGRSLKPQAAPSGPDAPWLARSQRIGPGGANANFGKAYSPGFGWQSIFLPLAILAIVVGVVVPKEYWDRLSPSRSASAPQRPEVLVVTGRDSYAAKVAETVGPRGYLIVVTNKIETALEKLQLDAGRIGCVVLDRDVAQADRLASAVQTTTPAARLVILRGAPPSDQIPQILINAGVN